MKQPGGHEPPETFREALHPGFSLLGILAGSAEEVHLNEPRARQKGRVHLPVAPVLLGHHAVGLGFADSPKKELPSGNVVLGKRADPLLEHRPEHGLVLRRRAGKKEYATPLKLQPLAGSRPQRVVQGFGSGQQEGLPAVDGRSLPNPP